MRRAAALIAKASNRHHQTVPHAQPHHRGKEVPVTVKTLDLDSTVIFTGGPSAKRDKWESFLAETKDVEEVWSDELSKWSVLRAVSPRGPTVRGALKAAGIETRREEATRNRLQNNQRRAHPTPQH